MIKERIPDFIGNIRKRETGDSYDYNGKTITRKNPLFILHFDKIDLIGLRKWMYNCNNKEIKLERKYKLMLGVTYPSRYPNYRLWDFEKARNFVRQLGLTSLSQWREWSKSGNRPKYIPSSPWKSYAEYAGISDWLGLNK